MNCKKIKELVMTDYIDGQLDTALYRQVKDHLNACSRCRELERSLRKAAVEPFKNLKEIKPDPLVWERIRESIEAEKEESPGLFSVLRDYLGAAFEYPRTALAVATTIAVFIITAVVAGRTLSSQRALNGYFQDQKDFLSSLLTDARVSSERNRAGLGTSIERYLL